MSQELRSALEGAAGRDPQVDLTEVSWARGRAVRRRRHAAQVVGGAATVAVLVGAFALGGGLREPRADVGPAVPTVQDSAEETVARPDPTTPDPTTPDPTTPESPSPTPTEPAAPPVREGFGLTSTSIAGVPLSGPTADLVAAISDELGEPFNVERDAVGGCGADEVYSLYNWEGFLLFVEGTDGPDAHRSWETSLEDADLPGGVRLGMTLDQVRSLDTVTELPTVASPRYQLGSGIVVSTDPGGRLVNARSEMGTVC